MRHRRRFDNVPIVFPETPDGNGSSIPFCVHLSLQVYFRSFRCVVVSSGVPRSSLQVLTGASHPLSESPRDVIRV